MASEESVVVETRLESHSQEGSRHVTVWVPHRQKKKKTGDEVPFVRRLATVEVMGSGKGVVDGEAPRYHCFTGIMPPGGLRYGWSVLMRYRTVAQACPS